MKLHDLRPAEGATQKRKRVGRGTGSGKGKTSTRGTKGQRARNGVGIRANFEGGQLPLTKRLPKLRGFNNKFKLSFSPVNLDVLDQVCEANAQVTPEALVAIGVLSGRRDLVAVLARGEISKPIHVKTHRISTAARQKIEAAGGSVELLTYEVSRSKPRS